MSAWQFKGPIIQMGRKIRVRLGLGLGPFCFFELSSKKKNPVGRWRTNKDNFDLGWTDGRYRDSVILPNSDFHLNKNISPVIVIFVCV